MSHADELRLAKGFIMNKMYSYNFTARHTSYDNIPKSCPLELRPHLQDAFEELKNEGLVFSKHTSYGIEVWGHLAQQGFTYANIFRAAYHIGAQLIFGKPGPGQKAPSLSTEELHKLKFRK